ncbi:hypothetical protein P3F83_18015 [Mycobacteroides immunogenum]|uniref:hypothetical protein n=1 Tax=Mycobacteroides immunogenum TaxID=83262 RepID=UPI0025B77B0B|nr:hypothetical protein [Mycobacteroides immunogenum]WJR32407.1 hypothetical protein P3F83_18015 [Mycobacteroides immunogenum]
MSPLSPLLNSPDDFFFAVAFMGLAMHQVWMVVSGRLVPRRTHERELASRDNEIVFLRETNGKQGETIHAYATPAQLAVRAVTALQEQT